MDSLALEIDLESVKDLSLDVAASRLPGEYIKLVTGLTPSAVDPIIRVGMSLLPKCYRSRLTW